MCLGDENVQEIHISVFEAVATVPLHVEEGFRVEELLADIRDGVGNIDEIAGLVADDRPTDRP